MFPDGDYDILVVSYLFAVAAALDERSIAVTTLRLGNQPDTLALHPATARRGPGLGPDPPHVVSGDGLVRRTLRRHKLGVHSPAVPAGRAGTRPGRRGWVRRRAGRRP